MTNVWRSAPDKGASALTVLTVDGRQTEVILAREKSRALQASAEWPETMPPVKEHSAYFGIPDWLTSYHKGWLRPDVIAGLTAAAVVAGSSVILFDPIFQGLAIALMAGEIASLLLSRMTVPVLFYLFNKRRRNSA